MAQTNKQSTTLNEKPKDWGFILGILAWLIASPILGAILTAALNALDWQLALYIGLAIYIAISLGTAYLFHRAQNYTFRNGVIAYMIYMVFSTIVRSTCAPLLCFPFPLSMFSWC